jgi:hypothetical protein
MIWDYIICVKNI